MDNTVFISRRTQENFSHPGSPDPIWSQLEVPGLLFQREVKLLEREANHSPPSVQDKSKCNYTSIPHIHLHGVCVCVCVCVCVWRTPLYIYIYIYIYTCIYIYISLKTFFYVVRHLDSIVSYIYIYIYRFQNFFYVVRHLDSIASFLPTGLPLGFFRSWPSLYFPSSFPSVFLMLSFVSASTSMLFWVNFLLPFSEHGRTM